MQITSVAHPGVIEAMHMQRLAPAAADFFAKRLDGLKQTLGGVYDSFVDRAVQVYNTYYTGEVAQVAAELVATQVSNESVALFFPCTTHKELIAAPPHMVQYLMAYPEVALRTTGYAATYVDYEPQASPELRAEYLQVTEGTVWALEHTLVNPTAEEDDDFCVAMHYHWRELPELHDKVRTTVLNSWRAAQNLLSQGIDPSVSKSLDNF